MTAQEVNDTVAKVFNDSVHMAEANWRALNDAACLGTMYELGFKAWKQWAEMQMALVDAYWKFGRLSMDIPISHEEATTRETVEHHASRPRKVASAH